MTDAKIFVYLFIFWLNIPLTVSSQSQANMMKQADNTPAANRYETAPSYLKTKLLNYDAQTGVAKLQVSWEASWRDEENWDAAWLFFKNQRGQTVDTQEVDCPSAAQTISDDQKGVFLFRKTRGKGSNNWLVKVALAQAANQITPHALEMVFIPEGPFELGTVKSFTERNNISTSRGSRTAPLDAFFTYHPQNEDGHGGPFPINSEAPISIGKQKGQLYYIDAVIPGTNTYSGDKTGTLPGAYPKGYQGFYQMRYELDQQQYCNFLNSLPAKVASNRFEESVSTNGYGKEAYRNTIEFESGVYQTDHPHRACNFMSWKDILAYADWSGLRIMTELEFEKSARGPQPAVWREFVWGVNELGEDQNYKFTSTIYNPDGSIANKEDGDEYVDGNVHIILLDYSDCDDVCRPSGEFYQPSYPYCRSLIGGDGGRGPLRKGIHAVRSDGDRVLAGASYYGAMDLGGSLQEPVVPVGDPFSRSYQGTHGDGHLSDQGEATNVDWLAKTDDEYVFGFRGGSWPYHENHARIADRFDTYRQNPNVRKPYRGFRGVRSVTYSQ